MVSNEMVVWMSYPESSRGLISVENTPRSFDRDDQVVFEIVVCLNCVFNKDVMTFSFVNYIVFGGSQTPSTWLGGRFLDRRSRQPTFVGWQA